MSESQQGEREREALGSSEDGEVIELHRGPLLGEFHPQDFFFFFLFRAETSRLCFLPLHSFVFHAWLHEFSSGRGEDMLPSKAPHELLLLSSAFEEYEQK